MRRVVVISAWTALTVGIACIGEDPEGVHDTPDEASIDAMPEATPETDASAPDAFEEAPSGHCTGPFGKPEPLEGGVNTSSNNEFPGRLSRDELELYFARQKVGDVDGIDLFVAMRTDGGGFDLGKKIEELNTTAQELEPSLGDDGGLIVFASLRTGGPGKADLYFATRDGGAFTPPKLIPGTSTTGNDFQPYVAGNGAALYFTRVETNGDYQIYVSRRNGDGSFAAPELVPGQINTDAVEGNPVLTEDELTIYFKRAPKSHHGPSNVLRSSRASIAEPFGFPSQVMELNTFADDAPSWISPDECTILIVSKAAGSSDLLVAHRSK